MLVASLRGQQSHFATLPKTRFTHLGWQLLLEAVLEGNKLPLPPHGVLRALSVSRYIARAFRCERQRGIRHGLDLWDQRRQFLGSIPGPAAAGWALFAAGSQDAVLEGFGSLGGWSTRNACTSAYSFGARHTREKSGGDDGW